MIIWWTFTPVLLFRGCICSYLLRSGLAIIKTSSFLWRQRILLFWQIFVWRNIRGICKVYIIVKHLSLSIHFKILLTLWRLCTGSSFSHGLLRQGSCNYFWFFDSGNSPSIISISISLVCDWLNVLLDISFFELVLELLIHCPRSSFSIGIVSCNIILLNTLLKINHPMSHIIMHVPLLVKEISSPLVEEFLTLLVLLVF